MRLIDADVLKEEMSKVFFNDNEDMIRLEKLIDNAPTVPQGDFTRIELESWLYAIAINNTKNELGSSCEEIIKRLDGFERYVSDMRKGDLSCEY